MAGKEDFTAEEWEIITEAPATAGLMVIMSSRGGTFRETVSMAKAWVEARAAGGESAVLDAIAAEKPEFDKQEFPSLEELRAKGPDQFAAAVRLLEEKASGGRRRGL